MQETRNNCFGRNNETRLSIRRKQASTSATNITSTYKPNALAKFKFINKTLFITFSHPCMVKKILFLYHISETEILMDFNFLGPLKPKITIFNGWSVCVRLLIT